MIKTRKSRPSYNVLDLESERPVERNLPYDHETKTVDLRYQRSTDLPFDTYVHMPPPLPEDEEIKLPQSQA